MLRHLQKMMGAKSRNHRTGSTIRLSAVQLDDRITPATIAQFTFESSAPTTAGPHAAEVGTGSVGQVHASGSTVYSNHVGNGSSESFSSNRWAVGDYFFVSFSTLGMQDISVSWDHAGSATGPRDFDIEYAVGGGSFTPFGSYDVALSNWSSTIHRNGFDHSFDLSSVNSLENQSSVTLRFVVTSASSVNGGSIGTSGTSRIDDLLISGNHAPVVSDQSFSVPENSPAGTVVGTVSATDADGDPLTYSITSGNSAGAFAISNTGVITVADASKLDYETTTQYSLTVAVSDGTATSNVTITISVSNVNDPPVFDGDTVFDVPPDVVDGTVVGNVHASDQDSGQTITYSLLDGLGLFAIDAQTGEISVTNAAALDDTVLYDLQVKADDGNGGQVQLQVQVNPARIRMTIGIAPLNYANNALIVVNINSRTPNTRVVLKLDGINGATIAGYYTDQNGPLLNEATTPMMTDANGNLRILIPASALGAGIHTVTVGRRANDGSIIVQAPLPGYSDQFTVLP